MRALAGPMPRACGTRQVEGWRLVTGAVHRAGGRIVAQLWHMGRLVHPDLGARSADQLVGDDRTRFCPYLRRQEALRRSERRDPRGHPAHHRRLCLRRPQRDCRGIRRGPDPCRQRLPGRPIPARQRQSSHRPLWRIDREPAALHEPAARDRRRRHRDGAGRHPFLAEHSFARRRRRRPDSPVHGRGAEAGGIERAVDRAARGSSTNLFGRNPDRTGQPGDAAALFGQDPAQQRL